jgi:sec-independent protein translocase protein TatA
MGNLGFSELLFIMVIALLVFGPKRLPELGKTLGKGLAEFKRATSGLKDSIEQELKNAAAEAKRDANSSGTPSGRSPNHPEAGTKPDAPKS